MGRGNWAEQRNYAFAVGAVLLVWLGTCVLTVARHEFFRDEVRPLSLARTATSPVDLYRLTQYDGHPLLWFLLLYIGSSAADTPLVLPVVSVSVAFAAVAVFLLDSPFPFWIRCLFSFCALPLYEYSVMARNYGIGMLLLFLSAALYVRRARHPCLLGLVLALLANTSAHAMLLACLIAALWAWEEVSGHRAGRSRAWRRLGVALALVLVGVALSVASTLPRKNSVLMSPPKRIDMRSAALAVVDALLRPDESFYDIARRALPRFVSAASIWLALAGLLPRPRLFAAALAASVALGVFFRLVSGGGYRHHGLFLVFLLVLYWVSLESPDGRSSTRPKGLLLQIGLLLGIVPLLLGNLAALKNTVWVDITTEMSSSKSLGNFLRGSREYEGAMLVAEPDYLLESLPYYTSNRIYFPREQRFGTAVSWTTEPRDRLSLAELLSAARDIQARHGGPVLIVLGHFEMSNGTTGEKRYSYNKVFSWTTDAVRDLAESTVALAEFSRSYPDERYRVYALR